MSAPKTDLEKQEKRHRGPLTGIVGVVVFALVLLLLFVGYVVWQGDSPEGAEQQIDGRTGEISDGAGAGGTEPDVAPDTMATEPAPADTTDDTTQTITVSPESDATVVEPVQTD